MHFDRIIDSQDQNAPRIEGSAESRRSVGASHAQYEHTPPPGSVHGAAGPKQRSRSKIFKELWQFVAVDFVGTTDPAEAETWLKRTERIFTQMRSTREEQFDLAVSLLQGDAYDWW